MALKILLTLMLIAGFSAANASDDQPDPELLEFLGRIAGLEALGIDIDTLLAESLEESLQPKEEDNEHQS